MTDGVRAVRCAGDRDGAAANAWVWTCGEIGEGGSSSKPSWTVASATSALTAGRPVNTDWASAAGSSGWTLGADTARAVAGSIWKPDGSRTKPGERSTAAFASAPAEEAAGGRTSKPLAPGVSGVRLASTSLGAGPGTILNPWD